MTSIITSLEASAATNAAIGSISAVSLAGIASLVGVGTHAVSSFDTASQSILSEAVNGALSAFGTSAGSIFSNIGQVLTGALSAIGNVLNTVINEVNKFLAPIDALLTKIQTLFGTISKLYDTINNLIAEIKAEASQGIQGILEIPGTIATALTSIESQTVRFAQQVTAGSKDIAQNVLVPGMSTAIGQPLKDIHEMLLTPSETAYNLTAGLDKLKLEPCGTSSVFGDKVNRIQGEFSKPSTWLDYLGKVISDVAWMGEYLFASIEADLECVKQAARVNNPNQLLGPGDAINAVYRGELTMDQALAEVRRAGFSPDRFKVLYETQQWLPGVRETLEIYYRGGIQKTDLPKIFQALHLTPQDAAAVTETFLEPVNPREIIAHWGRKAAADTGFLAETLRSSAPSEVVDAYAPRFRSDKQAFLDWILHWNIPDVDWWLTGWARGLISKDDVENAAIAKNIPTEILSKLFPIWQETIQLWMVPDILGAGMLTEAEATDYLHYIGIGDRDSALLVKWGLSKMKAPLAAQAAGLQKISAGNAKTMYEDGIIDVPTYTSILEAHGYTPEAAALEVALGKQELDIKAVKNYIDGLVAEVNAGLKSETQMVSEMYAAGLTEVQIATATNKVKSARVAKAKLPTKAEANDFLRYGIISGDQYVALVEAMGYPATTALDFYALEEILHGKPPKPLTITQASS